MRNYADLSPTDFERLVRDLLQVEWSERLETFPAGPDGGVDIRLAKDGTRINIQCKHSPYGTWSTIRGSLEREAQAHADDDLREFWLVTSARLTAHAKAETSRIFSRQGLVPEHILGQDDLDNLLNLHPEVEQRHYRLYASSVPVLQAVLHGDLFTRQAQFVARISDRIPTLARIDLVAHALESLVTRGHCIVTGPPGIGKTTLAEMVVSDCMSKGYEPYDIIDLHEVDTVWREETRQMFFCDDFLGQLSVDGHLERGSDFLLHKLLERLPDGSHLLVLTTRSHILLDTIRAYRTLADSRLEESVLQISFDSVSELDRARILSIQMRVAGLDRSAFESLRRSEGHHRAIHHPNYNPRLAQQIIESTAAARYASEEFADRLLTGFDDPSQLWSYVFWREINAVDRLILFALAAFPDACCESEQLFQAVKALNEQLGAGYLPYREMRESLGSLDGTLINAERTNIDTRIRFSNPGVRDFVLSEIASDRDLFGALLPHLIQDGDIAEILSWVSLEPHRRPTHFRELDEQRIEGFRMIVVSAVAQAVQADCSTPQPRGRCWEASERTAIELVVIFAQRMDCSILARTSVLALSKRWPRGEGDLATIVRLLAATWEHFNMEERAELTARIVGRFDSDIGERWNFRESDVYLSWLETAYGPTAANRAKERFVEHLADELEELLARPLEIVYGPGSDRDSDSDYQYFNQAALALGMSDRFSQFWDRYYEKWKTYTRTINEEYTQRLQIQETNRRPSLSIQRLGSTIEAEREEIDRLFCSL
jgi:hypothetical protein